MKKNAKTAPKPRKVTLRATPEENRKTPRLVANHNESLAR
jgi:hypothetical protein